MAEKLNKKLDEFEKSRRLDLLQKLQKGITFNKNKLLVGENEVILVDGSGKKKGQYSGRTGTNKVVNFNCNSSLLGELVNVKIERASLNSLNGKLISV
jgi:tRNA-2-methylthio-N6-dimethylallyladenosine synthase